MPDRDLSIFIRVKENMTAAMKRVDRSLKTLDGGVQRSSQALGKMSRTVFSLKGALVGLGVGLLGRQFLKTAESMEVYRTQLETALGSTAAAAEHLEWVKDFAAKTPFEIGGLVEASVKLENYGIKSKEVMRTLGDTAGALGKDIGVAVEALADAQTGEFERLKEFGIKSIQEAGKTYFLYVDKHGKEQRALVDRNNRAMITGTLTTIWNEKYEGGMEKMSTTWRGMWSNLKDWFTQFQEKVMNSGVFAFLKTGLANLLGWLNQMKEKGRMDIWANKMGKAMIKVFSAIAKVAANLPLVFHTVSSAIKNMFAFVLAVINEAILQTVEIVLDLGSKIPFIGEKFAGWRDAVVDLRKNVDDLAVSTLESANANDEAAIRAAEFAVKAGAAIDGLKDKTLKLADAKLQDAAATREQKKAHDESTGEEGPKAQAAITYDDDQDISSGDQEYFEKQMEQLRENEERKVAILDEYRFRRMEANGLEKEADMERMRTRHQQELEELNQLGASKVETDRLQAAQRLELERAFQGQRTAAVATGLNAVAQFFPKMKKLQLFDAVINAKGAILKAWNSGPFPWNLGAVAAVAGNVWPLISDMRSVGPGGGVGTGSASGGGASASIPAATPAVVPQEAVKAAPVIQYHIHGSVFGDLDSAGRALKPAIDKAAADGVA